MPTSDPLENPTDLSGVAPTTAKPSTHSTSTVKPSPKLRNKPSTRDRKSVIPKGCVIPIYVPKINEVFRELRTLDADTYPNAASALLRILIDTTTLEYIAKQQIPVRNTGTGQPDFKPRIEAVLDHYKAATSQRDVCNAAKNALLQPSGAIYIEQLHGQLHSRYTHPIPDNLRLGWDMIENWLKGVWLSLEMLTNASKNP